VTVSLLQACDDPALFGVQPWPRQREILAQIDSGDYREIVLALGRRSGKNLMAALVGLHDAAFRDLSRYLRRGERRHVVCVAANREQAGLTLQFVRELVKGSPLLRECVEGDAEDALTIRQPQTGAIVTVKTIPCSSRTGRGLAISTLIFDEMAHWLADGEGPAVADRVYRAMTPSVAQFREHARVLAISTPWGKTGTFAKLFDRTDAGEVADALAVQAPTWEMNPTLPQSFFDAEKAKDPESFAGEYGAEFLTSGGAYLNYERIQAVIDRGRFELHAGETDGPVAALDAGFVRDASALVIVGHDRNDGDRLRLVLARQWKPDRGELGFTALLDEVVGICREHGARRVIVDQFCSVPIREYLRRAGLLPEEMTMTAQSKSRVYGSLKSRIYSGTVELYPHDGLIAELGRIEAHYVSGGVSIRSPRVGGSHGDIAQALAVAIHALDGRRGGIVSSHVPRGRIDDRNPFAVGGRLFGQRAAA
jgi:hypothetical protein